MIPVFCITGGPHGGKTSALAPVRAFFRERGVETFVAPEVATKVFGSGIEIHDVLRDPGVYYQFQKGILQNTIYEEEMAVHFASLMSSSKRLVLCDRGLLDVAAYGKSDVATMLWQLGYSVTDAAKRYDAVFHMMSTAVTPDLGYGNATNAKRYEDRAGAAAADAASRLAWAKHHPRFTVIDNTTSWDDKLKRLCEAMWSTYVAVTKLYDPTSAETP